MSLLSQTYLLPGMKTLLKTLAELDMMSSFSVHLKCSTSREVSGRLKDMDFTGSEESVVIRMRALCFP